MTWFANFALSLNYQVTQVIKQKNLKKPRLLSRLRHCPSLERSRGFFLAPLFSIKLNSSKNTLNMEQKHPNLHKITFLQTYRPFFLIDTCKLNSTLRIFTNQVKMIGKHLKLTVRHSKWERGTFCKCNRTKQAVDFKLENLNLDKSFWNGSPWKKVDMISQFSFKFELLGKTQIIKQKDLEKPRLLSRLGQCPSFERSRGFFWLLYSPSSSIHLKTS